MRAGIMGSCSDDSYFVASSTPVRELSGGCLYEKQWKWLFVFLARHPWWWYQALSVSGAAKCFQHERPQKRDWSVLTLLKEWQNDFRIKQHLSCLSSENCFFFPTSMMQPFISLGEKKKQATNDAKFSYFGGGTLLPDLGASWPEHLLIPYGHV